MCIQSAGRESKAEAEGLPAVYIASGRQQPLRHKPAKQPRRQRDVRGRSSEEPHRLQTTGARREISRPDRKTPDLVELRPAYRTVVPEPWSLDESTIVGRPRQQSLEIHTVH